MGEYIINKAYAYNDYLMQFAKRYTRNEEDAKDAVQSMYLHLLTRSNIEQVNDDTFCGYLRRVLQMELLERKQHSVETEELPIYIGHSDTNKDDKEFLQEVFKKSLQVIPKRFRTIFEQYYSGMNVEMIYNRNQRYAHVCCIHNIIRQYDGALRAEMRRNSKKYI